MRKRLPIIFPLALRNALLNAYLCRVRKPVSCKTYYFFGLSYLICIRRLYYPPLTSPNCATPLAHLAAQNHHYRRRRRSGGGGADAGADAVDGPDGVTVVPSPPNPGIAAAAAAAASSSSSSSSSTSSSGATGRKHRIYQY